MEYLIPTYSRTLKLQRTNTLFLLYEVSKTGKLIKTESRDYQGLGQTEIWSYCLVISSFQVMKKF